MLRATYVAGKFDMVSESSSNFKKETPLPGIAVKWNGTLLEEAVMTFLRLRSSVEIPKGIQRSTSSQ